MESVSYLYENLVNSLIDKGLTITLMESMTGGFVASCITDISGSSAIFKGSYVCYSNEEKIRLGVPETLIKKYTVYSEEVAGAMARAAKAGFKSDIAVGITGNAGNIDPVNQTGVPGTVFVSIILCDRQETLTMKIDAALSRREMKEAVAEKVAQKILKMF